MNEPGNPIEPHPQTAFAGVPHQELSFLEKYGISPVIFGLASVVLVFFLYEIVGGTLTFLFFGVKLTTENATGFRVATAIGQCALILLPTIALARLATSKPAQYLRLGFPQPLVFVPPIIGIFSLQQMLQVYLVFQEKIPLPQRLLPVIKQLKELVEEAYRILVSSNSIPELLFVVVIVAFIPAIVEELMFRGLIQRSFEKGLGPLSGVVLTGVIFGAYHLNPFAFLPLAALGVYLGFLALRANSIWVSAAAHFFNNATASLAVYLHYDDDAIVTGNPGAMPVGILLLTFLAFTLLFLGSTYWFVRMTAQKEETSPPEKGVA
ncbi:MAG: CPBP family intramembrane glutamic endopeptidase [Bacteroidota bacterium]|jgi:membrane protease YdiL (CAAX protease family)